tara:strand:+ start:623 stop:1015 length:393 start_codon:yes stop_codon:yes gene_type:complete
VSAQLKTANLDSKILSYKIVEDTRLDQTAIVDVTQNSGVLRTIEVDATAANQGNNQHLKLKLTTTEVVVGTTIPDIVIRCIAQKRFITEFPGGLPFTGLTAWLTSSEADNATTNTEAAAGRYTIVRFVTN